MGPFWMLYGVILALQKPLQCFLPNYWGQKELFASNLGKVLDAFKLVLC